MSEEARTPLERAQRAVEQWSPHWAKSQATNVLLMNIKQEIEEAVRDAYERAALVAEHHETITHWEAETVEQDIADKIRALKGK